MSERLSVIYFRNALELISKERRTAKRINDLYGRLHKLEVRGDLADFFSNPFVSTALSILESFSKSNYRLGEAFKLLREAGEEAKKEKDTKKRR